MKNGKIFCFYVLISVCILLSTTTCGSHKPIPNTEFDIIAARAGLKFFAFPTEHFCPGSIVTLDHERNVFGSPTGSLRECCDTDKLFPTEGKGPAGTFLSSLERGISFDISSLQKVLPVQIKLGAEAKSAAFVVLRVPETTSALLGSIKIDEWVADNWDSQISEACQKTLLKPEVEVISEVIYVTNYSLTFYKSEGQKLEVSLQNVEEFISGGFKVSGGRVEAGSVVFNAKLPLLYTTYRPTLHEPRPRVSNEFNEKEEKFFSKMIMYSGFNPKVEFIRRMKENSYKVNRITTYIIHGTSVHIIDEIKGEWVKGTPLTYEFVIGTGTYAELGKPKIFDNDRNILLEPVKESYGDTEFHWIRVGKKFSITMTRTIDNALCIDGTRDFIAGVNRFKFLESYEKRVYLDREPIFVDAYAVNAYLEQSILPDGVQDSNFAVLQQTLAGLHDKEFLSKIKLQNLKQGWVFFKGQIPPKGLFVIRVACP
ncbi:MAG: hypothetical protein NT178_08070 [Proteobacteria bacterium]|nr:hypothetical protein [Pseudomonadota bacterium]